MKFITTIRRRTATGILCLLVAGCLVLRWAGLGFQLPQFVPVDALVLAGEADVLRHHGDPSYRLHPNLYPRLIPALSLLVPSEQDKPPATLEEHLARARLPYMQICVVIALLSVLAIPATYRIARHFLDRAWSLVAAFLMGTSVLHLWFSQEPRPHSGAVTLTLLAVLAALRLRRKPTASSFLLVGIAAGAAIGTLQSGVAVLCPVAAAFLFRSKTPRRTTPWLLLATLGLIAACAYALYPSMAGTPHAKNAEPAEFIALHGSTLILMGHAIILSSFRGEGIPIVVGALCLYDPLIAACALLGLTAWITRRVRDRRRAIDAATSDFSGDLLVVLAYALPYGAVIGLYQFTGQRFVIPLLPFLACLGASGLRSAWSFALGRRLPVRILVATSVVAILATQAVAAARLSWIRHEPDTSTEVAAWIRTHIRPEDELVLLGPGFDLPLLQTREAVERNKAMHPNPNQRWFTYLQSETPMADRSPDRSADRFDLETVPFGREEDRQELLRDPAGFLKRLGARWIVLELHRTWDWRGIAKLHDALGGIGTLEAQFSPDRLGSWGGVPIAHQGFDPKPFPVFWFLRILQARCTGMVLEIWSIRR